MNAPPITDHLAVALRCFAGPQFSDIPDPNAAPKGGKRREPLGASSWTLIFDCETTTHPGQALRFGAYQLRNSGSLIEAGLFYDPEGVTPDELATLSNHASANGLKLRTREGFVDDVFFARAYAVRATIVGFNLPFDISRLAIKHGTARMRGRPGFTFTLSDQKIYPHVRVQHMSRRAASIGFAATMRQRSASGHRRRGLETPVRRGHFIDVKTLAGALFARGFSLASLSKFLKVENPKLDFDDFDGPITDDMARYAVRDVQATWECYAELLTRFDRLGLSQTIAEKVYSEASIGKGYLREMGVMPWRKAQPDVPRQLLANIMGSYFGGRSEVRIRREIRQVILTDFLSMYPTVCTLMGLWQFVIAKDMTWRDATAETQTFLKTVDLAALQSQATWRQLTTLVRVIPDGDIFPVRAAYNGDVQATIGANYLSADTPMWFTLADCIAAKLLSGKVPQIVEAVRFDAGERQVGLLPILIGGNPDYCVDPNEDDFFKRVIELRQSIKGERDSATGDAKAALDTEQNALKIAANATSYGIYIEQNVDEHHQPVKTTVHSTTAAPFSFATLKAENPGTYFHPLLGTLITGAARLMLAIAETLATDSGLEWTFCDTDSMALAKPAEMAGADFAKRVAGVVDWFAPLNPYDFAGSILQIEKVNASLETGEAHPLYCLAISSKRYALFNLASDGTPIMRKVSAHGLGHLLAPYGYDDAPAHFLTPDKSVLGSGIERWHCDLWHVIVSAALSGRPDQVRRDYHPALSKPAISRYGATTPELLRWFKTYNLDRPYRDQVKPFGFLLSMMQGSYPWAERIIGSAERGGRKRASATKPIAPFDKDFDKALALAFDRETGDAINPASLKFYADALAQYHIQPEGKFLNGDWTDMGTTRRRHVAVASVKHIGKESHDWEQQAAIGLRIDSEITYGVAACERADVAEKLTALITVCGEREAATMLGLSVGQLKALASGGDCRGGDTLARTVAAKLPAALALRLKVGNDRQAKLHRLADEVSREGLRPVARRHGIDASNLRRKLERCRATKESPPALP
ncbi:DNA-directed DNA polymerase [Sphingomonas antarctica]|uniref:hypothetical protein n=1 Tax=Sphingomonas antarctica TaxID=2040274 RepID=UPI0039E958A6